MRKFHPLCSLLLRIKAPDDGEARCPLCPKYGALPEEVMPLLQTAQAAHLPIVGVSFHVGSGATQSWAYSAAIAFARSVFDTAERLGLPRMHLLDIGGGFTFSPQFSDASATIRAVLKTHFPAESGVTVISEPGRFLAEMPYTLATNIIGKRVRGELKEYWINDGIYRSMNCLLYVLGVESDPYRISRVVSADLVLYPGEATLYFSFLFCGETLISLREGGREL